VESGGRRAAVAVDARGRLEDERGDGRLEALDLGARLVALAARLRELGVPAVLCGRSARKLEAQAARSGQAYRVAELGDARALAAALPGS